MLECQIIFVISSALIADIKQNYFKTELVLSCWHVAGNGDYILNPHNEQAGKTRCHVPHSEKKNMQSDIWSTAVQSIKHVFMSESVCVFVCWDKKWTFAPLKVWFTAHCLAASWGRFTKNSEQTEVCTTITNIPASVCVCVCCWVTLFEASDSESRWVCQGSCTAQLVWQHCGMRWWCSLSSGSSGRWWNLLVHKG